MQLLPIYDEYLVAYRDRIAVPHASGAMMSFRPREPSVFQHALVIDGQVAGTWRVTERANAVTINVVPLRRLTARDRGELTAAAERYGRFAGSPVMLSTL